MQDEKQAYPQLATTARIYFCCPLENSFPSWAVSAASIFLCHCIDPVWMLMSESQSFRTHVCVFVNFDRLFDSFRMHKEKAALTLKLGTFLPTGNWKGMTNQAWSFQSNILLMLYACLVRQAASCFSRHWFCRKWFRVESALIQQDDSSEVFVTGRCAQ